MTDMEISEHIDREEFEEEYDEFMDLDLRAKVLHHENNGEGDKNYHAIILGESAIILEKSLDDGD